MLNRLICKTRRPDQRGITGLETAIILIAFVVVAAVFAYTVLSAGIFSSQKSSEAVYAGLEETQSTLELKGGVVAYADSRVTIGGDDYNTMGAYGSATVTSSDYLSISRMEFTVAIALGGEPIDLTPPYTASTTTGYISSSTTPTKANTDYRTIITYTDQEIMIDECAWTLDWVGQHTDDYVLEANEKAVITVYMLFDDTDTTGNGWSMGNGTGDPFIDATANLIGTDHTFSLEVKPENGAVLTIERTTPGYLDTSNDLH